jgi:ATP-dependent Clp protease ATP-binding subunit ClpC
MDGYHFTTRIRMALSRAREESARMHYEYVGTEQILLGLVADPDNIAVALLEAQNISADQVRAEVAREANPAPGTHTGPDLPYSARSKRVLEFAMTEAREMGDAFIDTGHLLVALAREKRDLGARVLRTLGFSRDAARTTLSELHAAGQGEMGGLTSVAASDAIPPEVAAKFLDRVARNDRFAPVFKAHGIDVAKLIADIRKAK